MKRFQPKIVSITDRNGDELWIGSTIKDALDTTRRRPGGATMATRPVFAEAPLLTRLDVLAASALVGFLAGFVVGFAL